MAEKEYLTVSELITLLGISRPTIYKMIREGKLDVINTGQKYLINAESIKLKNPAARRGQRKGVRHDVG